MIDSNQPDFANTMHYGLDASHADAIIKYDISLINLVLTKILQIYKKHNQGKIHVVLLMLFANLMK
jgi:hypothetical protein